jgi:hypothetical protein
MEEADTPAKDEDNDSERVSSRGGNGEERNEQ